VVEGRRLEDDATVLLELEGGVRTTLLASQIATGERNRLNIRVYGSEAGLEWSQENPNRLRLVDPNGDETILHRGSPTLSANAQAATRLPGGHPEGFIEAFANVYRGVADAIVAASAEGSDAAPQAGRASSLDFPTAQDGALGVHFIHQAVRSHRDGAWVDMTWQPPH